MSQLILRIEYDGSNYCGWQTQPNARTVEDEIRKALKVIYGSDSPLVGAGRTDAGVHASGQVSSCEYNKLSVSPEKLIKAFNSYLPKDIRINGLSLVQEEFHARFDAVAREYSFTITNRESVFYNKYSMFIKYPFNVGRLMDSTQIFLGRHDFTTFSKRNDSTKKYVCNVQICEWTEIDKNTWKLKIKADRFVYGMVRSIVGAMLDVARNKRDFDEVSRALALKDRTLISPLASANGLVLERIYYPTELGNTFQVEQ